MMVDDLRNMNEIIHVDMLTNASRILSYSKLCDDRAEVTE